MKSIIIFILIIASINTFSQQINDIVLIFNNVYPDGGDLYELENVLADDSIRTNIPGLDFVSMRVSVILPGYTWDSFNVGGLSADTKNVIRQASTTDRRGPAGIAKVYLNKINLAYSHGDSIIIPSRVLKIRRVSTYMEPEIQDTILIFNNVLVEMVDGVFLYSRSDIMSADTIRTNIPGLKVVSFNSVVSCYCNFRDPNTCFLNDALRSLLKNCKKGYLKISDLTIENKVGERFTIPYQEIHYSGY